MRLYLSELDSVRRTKEEIATGKEKLFYEVVCTGNAIVLSPNQLVDSPTLLSGIGDSAYYNALVELIEVGRLQIYSYGPMRTAAQYLLSCINKREKEIDDDSIGLTGSKLGGYFLFSSLPQGPMESAILYDLKCAIMNSDLALLEERSAECEGEVARWYAYLHRLASLTLLLSRQNTLSDLHVPLESHISWLSVLRNVLRERTDVGGDAGKALALLDGLLQGNLGKDLNRSDWDIALAEYRGQEPDAIVNLAETMVDVCYVLSFRQSIPDCDEGSSKNSVRATVDAFWNELDEFKRDYAAHGHAYHSVGVQAGGVAATLEPSSSAQDYDWAFAARFAKRNSEHMGDVRFLRMDPREDASGRSWKNHCLRTALWGLLVSAAYTVVLWLVDESIGRVKTAWKAVLGIAIPGLLVGLISMLVFGFLTFVIKTLVMRLPGVVEIEKEVVSSIHDYLTYASLRRRGSEKG